MNVETLKVLEMVAEGTLSPDDANALLEALGALGRSIGLFEFLELLEFLIPAALQGACDETVVGIDRFILAFGPPGLIMGTF